MKSAGYLISFNLSGFFELDKAGVVLYSRFGENNQWTTTSPELVGQNFFEEVADFDNIGEFRRIFLEFVKSRRMADNFVFNCRIGTETIPVRVMMLRGYEMGCNGPAELVILDIRKNVGQDVFFRNREKQNE